MNEQAQTLEQQIAVLKAENAALKKELERVRKQKSQAAQPAERPNVGDEVIVTGLSSWKGWVGTLISVDEANGKGVVRIVRKKAGRTEDCPTALFRIQKAPKK